MKGAFSAANVIIRPTEPVGETSFDKATNVGIAEASVIAANRDFYDQVARSYERYESCAFDSYFQRLLEVDLVRRGVDDIEILGLLRRNQFTILEHLRYPAGRTRTVRFWSKRFRLLENFKIIAQRAS